MRYVNTMYEIHKALTYLKLSIEMHTNFAGVSKFGIATFCLWFAECQHSTNPRGKTWTDSFKVSVFTGFVEIKCMDSIISLAFSLPRKLSKIDILSVKNHI